MTGRQLASSARVSRGLSKKDGRIVEFSTSEEAGAKAKELNEAVTMTKVKYTARECNYGGDK